jgi:serine/threonine-protein kinase
MVDLPEVVRYWDALGGHSAISPDGTMIVFVGSDSASQQSLWVRPMNSHSARQLAGTNNASYPFWSPEGISIGFFADGKLKTIDAGGGPAIALADAPFGRGGAWSTTGDIVFSPSVSDPNLYAVPAAGGSRRLVTPFDSTKAPRFPFFLPDGVHFVFSLLEGGQLTVPSLRIGSLEDPRTTLLTEGASHGMVTAGTMVYLRQGILMAQPFDESSRTLAGRPVSIQDNINAWAPRAKADFSVSRNGVLLYAGGRTAREDEVIWIGEDGNETSIVQVAVFSKPVLSPDGTRFAYDEVEQQQETHVWVYDLERKSKTRITFDPHRAGSPCWSRDGKTLYFNLEEAGNKGLIGAKPADGSGTIEVIARADQGLSAGYYPVAVTPDGRQLLLLVEDESKSELGIVDLPDGGRPAPVIMLGIRGPGRTRDRNSVSLSPDGRWIAYESSDLGTRSIFVTAFGGQSGRWQISPQGAMNPIWSEGGIVYYSMGSNRNERVDFSAVGGTPTFSPPKPVFPPGKAPNNMLYGSTAGGRRHLALRRSNSGSESSLYLVVNWQVLMSEE